MKDSFFPILIVIIQVSVFVQILFIVTYLKNKSRLSFIGFLFTTIVNLILIVVMLVMLVKIPGLVSSVELEEILLIESGLVFIFLSIIKIRISMRIFVRSKDPDYYDINFFGKKVYKTTIISKGEVAAFILSTPVTMFSGAYFIVRLLF